MQRLKRHREWSFKRLEKKIFILKKLHHLTGKLDRKQLKLDQVDKERHQKEIAKIQLDHKRKMN